MSQIISTPASCFENLPNYPFKPNFWEVAPDLKMHYVAEGDPKNPIILLLHGEPTWSYLYRKMISILSESNFYVIAPDLIGFGKSDKYIEQSNYTYQKHIDWLKSLINGLKLSNITLFCQDWGGLIGLRIAAEMDEKFARIIASNTFLPTGQGANEAFLNWRKYSQNSPEFNCGKIVRGGCLFPISDDAIAAYNAPFPSDIYLAGPRIFPTLVPITEDNIEVENNKKAWQKFMQWQKPFLTIFGDEDKITKGAEKVFQNLIPGASNQNHQILNAGHFIQEDKGEELAQIIILFCHENPI